MASDRIESLIARMTVEEKVGQLGVFADMVRPFAPDVNPEANVRNADEVLQQVRSGLVGSLFNGGGAESGRMIQRAALESRMGIPVILAADVIHGMRTVFPIPLGESASFEPDLAERTARATAVEATAAGIHWTYAPAVDIARDQRWGRGAEGAGEDVVLGCAFAAARVRGFHGPDLRADDALLATPKHFAAYGAVAAGMEYASVDISPQTLRDVHLPPFKAAFEAGALSVMTSFNDINGVPASANHELLTEILRGEWKFRGVVVSDYTADMELIAHGYAADERDATKKAFLAGMDMSMQSGFYAAHLPSLVEDGEVPMALLDASVRRVLELKEAIGLLDDPYRSLDPAREADQSHIAAHDALAREAARRSIVLLKNDGPVLPLRKQGQKIALIGPFVQDRDNIEGCWTLFGDKSRYVTLEAGVRAALDDAQALTVVPGCALEAPLDGGIEAAVAAARAADVVVLALGEPQRYSGEAQSRTQIVLPPAQQALAEAVAATGTPLVVLLRNGRALALQGAVRDAAAIAVTWYLGTQTGPAVADVLFGDYNPSARLPVSFPLDAGQQPYFYNHPRTGRPELPTMSEFKSRWREVPNAPLYPFGHGLGYTQFVYGAPQLDRTQVGWDDTLTVTTRIDNVGEREGEEVVQLYIHDRVASRVRPVRELKAFRKVRLAAGEGMEVSFTLDRHALAFTGRDGQCAAEPGLFDLWVCASAASGEPVAFELLPQA
ncbi:glycoside hydrolase family 3 N-terminal domain-containing protein [Xanthomonas rydalmerensis]|uniref:beta-glucosidase n=1 Tax=Xanthomonas rydalmerensis TaxID=3046274 RepID=A0ABZ0JNH2_9XANT|nr:glycoside hydrolase family 3 N-terminal domain-containing protein [Xanthomonas sp. DM-2023]WOS41364.1 glycoside hydrolase family 3 N-terminal domain-containing protein [Xanthomonas sp. DM-2023]WOS45549.1 glycoside hydrolase family 3 N-terminal domain-containing protein [Xanthomonas sp. DM-2023]WOS49728.1 glycoside hydrolase family 3 N-terminal domain-containing protein [Xanthomonas sp. DM-2023]WOS53908.1 glycoside hydrolase family 3 N-terminal domain-containing protein [Xanthomonas sp. DM-20